MKYRWMWGWAILILSGALASSACGGNGGSGNNVPPANDDDQPTDDDDDSGCDPEYCCPAAKESANRVSLRFSNSQMKSALLLSNPGYSDDGLSLFWTSAKTGFIPNLNSSIDLPKIDDTAVLSQKRNRGIVQLASKIDLVRIGIPFDIHLDYSLTADFNPRTDGSVSRTEGSISRVFLQPTGGGWDDGFAVINQDQFEDIAWSEGNTIRFSLVVDSSATDLVGNHTFALAIGAGDVDGEFDPCRVSQEILIPMEILPAE